MSAVRINTDNSLFGVSGTNDPSPSDRLSSDSQLTDASPSNSPDHSYDINPVAARFQETLIHRQLAVEIRQQDKSYETADALLDKMKEKLTKIVKNYPPFPADSPERARLLRSLSALKKEIEELTYPPDNDGILKKIKTEKAPLDIPSLSEDASDKDIESALEKLTASKKRQAEDKADLARQTGIIAETIQKPVRLMEWLKAQGIKIAVLNESEADDKSREVMKALTGKRIANLNDYIPS